MRYYFEALKKYAVFSGRATRAEYWYFVLFNFIAAVAIVLVGNIIFGYPLTMVLSWIYALAVFIPGLAVAVRRLHDTGRSGWWIFINLVPFIGSIVLLVFLIQDSQPGENKYGPNPKEETNSDSLGEGDSSSVGN